MENPSLQQKHILVILGAHRSGTSVLTGVLHLLGMNVSDKLLPSGPENPKGYFESEKIVHIHEYILHFLGKNYDVCETLCPEGKDLESILENDVEQSQHFVAWLKNALIDEMKDKQIWGFKDPRTSKFLPLWSKAFQQCNVNPVYIISIRKPSLVVKSLQERMKLQNRPDSRNCNEFWSLLWIETYIDIFKHFKEEQYPLESLIVMDYDDWFVQDPNNIARQIDYLLERLPFLKAESDKSLLQSKVSEFITSELRHQENKGDEQENEGESILEKFAEDLYCNMKAKRFNMVYESINMFEVILSVHKELKYLSDH